ncbi:hypothetical protein QEZ54_23930 [Catellatospora sp. KI3]|uniref:hypothetical protein n=1 Tax=Catellatospora sp. KI3 TaxID=3041620 RepID=UPI002482B016|nr:hypothetical protein [Catellatospora sp. KI3]MDI1464039.1 hypothetical protein [Catellatospora sp. KI3]
MHRRTLMAAALAVPVGAVVGAEAAQAHRPGPRLPATIALPDGFCPEGITHGTGGKAYIGSMRDGAIYCADLKTGHGMPLVAGTEGGKATGLAFDAECRIWAACGTMGGTAVYDESGTCLAMYHLGGNVHGVAATSKNVFFTDADQGNVYCVGLGRHGSLPGGDAVMTLALPGGLGEAGACNKGIVAAWNGCLIIVQAAANRLYAFDPTTRMAKRIDIGRASVAGADGLLLRGRTLYVVRPGKDRVSKFHLSHDLSRATLVDRITDADLDCPSTVTAFGGSLYAVNARFSTPPATSTEYCLVRLRD